MTKSVAVFIMAHISQEKKVLIYRMYFNQGLSIRQIRDTLTAYFPEEDMLSKSTIHRTLQKFNSGEEVHPRVQQRARQDRSLKAAELILGAMYADSNLGSRKIGESVGYSKSRVLQVLHENNFKPYKLQGHQELLPNDNNRRNSFCEDIFERANRNENFLKNVCFTDECTFFLQKQPNRQNTRIWAKENPRRVVTTHTQYPKKINVWAGILGHNIIGPFIIEGSLTGHKYLSLLQDQIIPEIRRVANIDEVWLQQDGCPAHFVRPVTNLLDETFPNRWIGRGGPICWPPRSPDLSPNDFFLWPYIFNKIYKTSTKYETREQLENAIRQAARNIDARILANMRRAFYDRCNYCLIQNGGLFEHLIK